MQDDCYSGEQEICSTEKNQPFQFLLHNLKSGNFKLLLSTDALKNCRECGNQVLIAYLCQEILFISENCGTLKQRLK